MTINIIYLDINQSDTMVFNMEFFYFLYLNQIIISINIL